MRELTQAWPRPSRPQPIVVIGAGSIVRTAHLPAYRRLGLRVAGIYDIWPEAARNTAAAFGIDTVFDSLEACCASPGVVFDVAVPADQTLAIIRRLPRGSAVLMQKPMGESLADARAIRDACRHRELVAAMNFQLRFSPNVLAVRDLLSSGELGDLLDIEVRLVTNQPWQLWDFLEKTPRVEVLYHSIHYLDTIRMLAGEPAGVYCKGVRHPDFPRLRDTRGSIILDYGDRIRCSLSLNHTHRFGERLESSAFKIEGSRGAAVLTMGVNLDYPLGRPDTLDVALAADAWERVALRGSWFIEAFEGPMSNLQRFAAGEDDVLLTSVEDAIRTMAVVEACYQSSAGGATPVPGVDG